jgi:hypothetical protein
MVLLFCKLFSSRTAILLWLLFSFAGQLLNDPRRVFAAAASSPSGATTSADGQEPHLRPPSPPTSQSNEESPPSTSPSRKQKNDLLKSNFEKLKHDAESLAVLAKSLQEELDKSNENILSLDVVDKAEKIEKLARKIKDSARGL